jgi:hypothetical protein
VETLLEILKYTLPSLVVFGTAYFLLKQHLDDKYKLALLSYRGEGQKITLPLRLQAYERYALLCDRINLPNLIMRVRTPEMTVRDLKTVLYISINQEFEHNASMQIYISQVLWQILKIAKEDTVQTVMIAAQNLDPNAPAELLVNEILKLQDSNENSAVEKAIMAIRTELSTMY